MANIQKPRAIFWAGLAVIVPGLIFLRIPPVDGFWTLIIAPILLVIGYVIMIPIGIRPRRIPPGAYLETDNSKIYSRSTMAGAVSVFIVTFVIYLVTLWPEPGWWDSSEYITSAYTLGVTSPPGSFMLQLIGRVTATVIPILTLAVKINMLAALFSSLAAAVVYYITIRILLSFNRGGSIDGYAVILSGVMAALTFAFTQSIWCKATFANPYALSLLTGCLLIYLAITWWDKADTPGGGNYLLMAAFLFGLDLSVHRSNFLFAPFFIILILIRSPRAFLDWRLWLGSILIFFAGLSMQLGIMLRAQLNPEINFGDPDTLGGLWNYFNLRQFDISVFGLDLLKRKGPFWGYQVNEMYLRYLGWNFIGLNGDNFRVAFTGMYGIPILFGMIGLVVHFIRRSKHAIMFFIAFLFASLGAIFYLNVPAGFFREMDRHFVISFMMVAVWIGVGVYAALYYFPRLFKQSGEHSRPVFWIIAGLIFVMVPFNTFRANFNNNNMRANHSAGAFGRNLLESCEKDAILITSGDSDTFTAWYARRIEKVRCDVTVINVHLLNTSWYLKTLLDYYPDIPWTMTEDLIAALAPIKNEGDSIIVTGADNFGFVPRSIYVKDYLIISDQILIDIIRTNKWRRPICFSFGFGENVPLALKEYCRLDGLVWKLCPNEREREDITLLEKNIERYDYRGIRGHDYLDPTGRSMTQNYLHGIVRLAEHYNESGNTEKFDSLKMMFDRHWDIPGGLERFLGMDEEERAAE